MRFIALLLYDDPLGSNSIRLFSDAFRDEIAAFFHKAETGHSKL